MRVWAADGCGAGVWGAGECGTGGWGAGGIRTEPTGDGRAVRSAPLDRPTPTGRPAPAARAWPLRPGRGGRRCGPERRHDGRRPARGLGLSGFSCGAYGLGSGTGSAVVSGGCRHPAGRSSRRFLGKPSLLDTGGGWVAT